MSYWHKRKLVEQMNKAQGRSYVDIPAELLMLETEESRAKYELERLKAAKADEKVVGEAAVRVGELQYRMKQLIISYKLK